MKLIVELFYDKTRIDAIEIPVYPSKTRVATTQIDITRHVEERVKAKITKLLKILTPAAALAKMKEGK